jgi:DinB superfamily
MTTSRETLQPEFETTRASFHDLLNSIPDQALEYKSPGNVWSIKAELWHIAQSLGFLTPAIISVHRGRTWGALYLRFPLGIRSWINGYLLVPFLSRRATRQEIARAYDKAYARIMAEFDRTREGEGVPGVTFPVGYRTFVDLFHGPSEHFQLHAERIRQNLDLYKKSLGK